MSKNLNKIIEETKGETSQYSFYFPDIRISNKLQIYMLVLTISSLPMLANCPNPILL